MRVEDRTTPPVRRGIGAALRRLFGLARTRIGFLSRRPGATPASAWGSAVDQVAEDLENLNRTTERDFLAVGEKLMEFRSTARQITVEMAALTELISGEQSRSVSHALNKTLDHSKEMDAQIARGSVAFERVGGLSSHVRQIFAGLRNAVSAFRTLCTLTRIETSRLGGAGAGFGDLAAEVGPLSESIQTSGEGILEASGRLDRGVQSAMRRAAELRLRQLRELPAMIDGVIDGLRSFEERRARALETSARQAVQYEALCGAVAGVVEAVQFHDITRQQIEHVVQALRHLRPEYRSGSRSPNFPPPAAGPVLVLQSSQVCRAAGVFASSVERIERDLESIAARVLETAEASRALLGISAGDQDSFFLAMEGRLTAILNMLGICSAAQGELERTAASLEETVTGMRESVGGIREIEIRIERIALNAMIRATHIGVSGNALEEIAEFMQGLARDSNARSEDATVALDAMSAAAGCVSGGAGLSANELIGEMRRTLLELHSSSERSFSRVNQIAALGAQLAADIGALRGGFSAGRLFAEVAGSARAELERIAEQAVPGLSEGGGVVPDRQMESLAKRYTMQAERDVHQSLAGGSEAATPAAAPGGDGEWLGENVELF